MEISKKYQSRHGFACFEKKTFKITNSKNETTINCELLKVPTYSFIHKYKEKICEGNGWYTIGDTIKELIVHDFYWIIILNNKCLGVINENIKKSLSSKYAIQDLNGLKYIKEYIKSK